MKLESLVKDVDILALDRELYSKDFYEFVMGAWDVIEPGREFYPNWHIGAICEHLTAVSNNQIRNLLINIPPRCSKSLLVSVLWPAWEWIKKPNTRWLCASYSHQLSIRDSVRCRRVVESHWYKTHFSDSFSLAPDQNEKSRFENNKTGYRIATSVGGTGTGEGADRLLCDDPHKVMEAYSKTQRESTIQWWDEEMSTRGNDPMTHSKVIIMQRIHSKDLSGHVLEQGDYEHLMIPMEHKSRRIIYIEDKDKVVTKHEVNSCDAPTSIGWTDPRTQEGELLWENRFPRSHVDRLKKVLGTRAASGQLAQDPTPDKGALVQRDWWKFYTLPPSKFEWIALSWDFSFKKADDTDYVVGQVWGKVGAYLYLLDQVRDRMGFNETLQTMITLNSKWSNANENLLEEKANGSAILDTLRSSISGLVSFNPTESKYARAAAASPHIESGNIFLPDPTTNQWVHNYIEEWAMFPKGDNDDQVDATSQIINRLLLNFGGWEEYLNNINSSNVTKTVSDSMLKMFWG